MNLLEDIISRSLNKKKKNNKNNRGFQMNFLNNTIARSNKMMNPLSQLTDNGNDNDNSQDSGNYNDKDTKNPDCLHHT